MKTPIAVVLGMMSSIPVAGVVWQTVHYLVGLQRLGFDVYYVEAHARTPGIFMESEDDDGTGKAAAFIARAMSRFGFSNAWAYHALHEDGRCYGMTVRELERLYGRAEVLLNLHGGTVATDAMAKTERLVYIETDPVQVQLELDAGDADVVSYLAPHCALFTFAENYGNGDCLLPTSDRFDFHPTRQPVVLDLWETHREPGPSFTTIGQWRQEWRDVDFNGDVYRWSKHHEFLKLLDLPARTGASFHLALGNLGEADRELLASHGWGLQPAETVSADATVYRDFIQSSRGEFTVAKDQNIRLRTGWFSDRSATYLAAGRPVVTQETGFSNVLPTGAGLFAFGAVEEACDAVAAIALDYERHTTAASEIAHEFFDAERVLGDLLEVVGVDVPRTAGRRAR